MHVIELAKTRILDRIADINELREQSNDSLIGRTMEAAAIIHRTVADGLEEIEQLKEDFNTIKGLSYARATQDEKDLIRKYARV